MHLVRFIVRIYHDTGHLNVKLKKITSTVIDKHNDWKIFLRELHDIINHMSTAVTGDTNFITLRRFTVAQTAYDTMTENKRKYESDNNIMPVMKLSA